MLFSDDLFFIVLFSAPAALFILFNRYIRPVPKVEHDETARISAALFFSFITLFANIAVLKIVKFPFDEFLNQSSIFTNVSYLLVVMLSILVTGFALCQIWYLITRSMFIKKLINKYINKKIGMAETTRNNSIFADIFDDDVLNLDIPKDCVVKIEKDNLVTVGVLHLYSSHASSKIEIVLRETSLIQQYLDHDSRKKNEQEKIFSKILYEYADLTNGSKFLFTILLNLNYTSRKIIDYLLGLGCDGGVCCVVLVLSPFEKFCNFPDIRSHLSLSHLYKPLTSGFFKPNILCITVVWCFYIPNRQYLFL